MFDVISSMADGKLYFLAVALVFVFVLQEALFETVLMQWPCTIQGNATNNFLCTINKDELTKAQCAVAAAVGFDFRQIGTSSSSQLCSLAYPPSQCTGFTGVNTCGCIGNDTATYKFQFNFMVTKEHVGGLLECKICVNPAGPYNNQYSSNKHIHLGNPCKVDCQNGGICGGSDMSSLCYSGSKEFVCVCPPSHQGETCEEEATNHAKVGIIVGSTLAGTAVLAGLYKVFRPRPPTASPASPGVEMAPVAAGPAVNQTPEHRVEDDAQSESSA